MEDWTRSLLMAILYSASWDRKFVNSSVGSLPPNTSAKAYPRLHMPTDMKLEASGCTTYQLYFGEVALPPEVFLVLRSQSRHPIVRVHDDVNEGVDHGTKEGCEGKEQSVHDMMLCMNKMA